jgi:hypothetical protein
MSDAGSGARPEVLVVSYFAAQPLTPRGARTQAIARALARHAHVRVIGASAPGPRRTWWHRGRDHAISELGTRLLIDSFEPWSWRSLRRLRTDADVALLIGYPFSPLVAAARSLRRAGVPYVVDVSDPWVLTRSDDGRRPTLRERRSADLERRLWDSAAAGIVTTAGQERALARLVPGLEILVRPNGYSESGPADVPARGATSPDLTIGHFGNLYTPRVGIRGLIERIATARRWRRVTLLQYGRDHHGELRNPPDGVSVELHEPVPWPEVLRLAAARLDLALVIGNTDPTQLPSKAIEYLTLPVPRMAVTSGRADDALAAYVSHRPGWLAMSVGDTDPATRIWEHVNRGWTPAELAPPDAESWAHVGRQLAAFVLAQAPAGIST